MKFKRYLLGLSAGLVSIFIFQVSIQAKSIKADPNMIRVNQKTMRPDKRGVKVVNWNKSTGRHPDLTKVPARDLKLLVNTKRQTLNIYVKNKLKSQLLVSTGKSKTYATPIGTYQIQPENDTWFYNNQAGIDEGAKNWISFKDHGVYLFHSIVMDQNQQPILSRQGRLGKPNSHGCIQMSLSDNKWFYQMFKDKVGTQVVIK